MNHHDAARGAIRNPDGFSLVEALVATGIFVVAAGTLLQLVTTAVAANGAARHQTDAATLASRKVEALLAMPWGTEAAGTDNTEGYVRSWSVSPLAANAEAALVLDVRVACRGIPDVHLVAVKLREAP